MEFPGKGTLKKAFVAAAACVGLAGMTGCAVVPDQYGRLYVEPVVPAPVYVEPAPVYVAPPVIVVPAHPYYYHHRGYGHRW